MSDTTATIKKTSSKKRAAATVDLNAPVYTQTGTTAGTIALPANLFGVAWNDALVHQVITGMQSNARAGTAHAKDRGEVRGGGKKPWKQKGTGRARHGSSRSPLWVGGGTTHGPRNDKDYSKKINRKMAAKALVTLLSRKYAEGKVLFVDTLSLAAPKTKNASAVLTALATVDGFKNITSKKATAVVIVVPEKTDAITKSFANIPGATVLTPAALSAVTAFNANHMVVVHPQAAIDVLSKKVK